MDQFFDTLLLDGRILYSKFNGDTRILDLTYGDTLYELSLEGFIDLYPQRKKYTLQAAGLYYLACTLGQLTPSFLREDILNNYREFKSRNDISKTDFISLILICVPAFLLTVIKGDTGSNIQDVLKKSSPKKLMNKTSANRRSMDESAPGGFYVFMITIGVMTTLVTSEAVAADVVYAVTREVFENLESLRAVHPALARLQPAEMLLGRTAPLHPGAERYYREAGLL
jgi:hypothetical protein